jgi:hypothetical protein
LIKNNSKVSNKKMGKALLAKSFERMSRRPLENV